MLRSFTTHLCVLLLALSFFYSSSTEANFLTQLGAKWRIWTEKNALYEQDPRCEYWASRHPLSSELDRRLLHFLYVQMPRIEAKARRDSSKDDRIKFNELLDEQIRKDRSLGPLLLQMAFRRLPYLRQRHFTIFLSGGGATAWGYELSEYLKKENISASLVLLSGNLSTAREDRKHLPVFPEDLQKTLKDYPSIFLDDSLSNGGTAKVIRNRVQALGGNLHGVFVVYLGGHGDASALYKSGRKNDRKVNLGNFLLTPVSWEWKSKPVRFALELDGTIRKTLNELSLQGAFLLETLQTLSAEVLFLIGGKPIEAPAFIVQIYPKLKYLDPYSQVDLALGNWNNSFHGMRDGSVIHKRTHYILETCELSPSRSEGCIKWDELPESYFLNRLVELGVLTPVFDSVESPKDQPNNQPNNQKVPHTELFDLFHAPGEDLRAPTPSTDSDQQLLRRGND